MSGTWTFVCATAELLPGEMKSTFDEVTGTPIVVFNLDGDLYALEDQCTHEEFELSSGTFDTTEGSIECVLHSARFDVRATTATEVLPMAGSGPSILNGRPFENANCSY
jgi:3-phenylpropionate/trans-cinnamate dioxygenase ferredoxin subunit